MSDCVGESVKLGGSVFTFPPPSPPPPGKAYQGVRVREPGPYGHAEKWSLILAIDCAGRKWCRFAKVPGTTVEIFNSFIANDILTTHGLVPGSPAFQRRVLMWDNLRAHHSPIVYNTVTFAGHDVLARPPYRPCDGPIEYVFNHLQMELTHRIYSIADEASFVNAVMNIITNLGPGFDACFQHCGYV